MQDRPTVLELLAAVRGFLEEDLAPALEGRRRFHALVAANVLRIVERELAGEEGMLVQQWDRLASLFGIDATERPQATSALRTAVRELETRLAERIRAGDADAGEFADRVRAHVRATVVEKLAVANPRFLGGRPA
jgi:alcohol dehydrogenase class IV